MANDPDYISWDTLNVLNWKIIVKIEKLFNSHLEIMSFEEYDSLPISKTIKFEKTNSWQMALKIINGYGVLKECTLPKMSKFDVNVTIDSNALIMVNFNETNYTNLRQTSTETKNDFLNKFVAEDLKVLPTNGGRNREKDTSSSSNSVYEIEMHHLESVVEQKLSSYKYHSPIHNRSKKQTNDCILPKKLTKNMENDAIGIDLGTSRCCAAVNRMNGIQTVPLDNKGERLLPSFVAYDETNIKCGQVVIDRLRNYSKSTIYDSKRIIGRSFNEIEIDQFWPFKISNTSGNIFMGVTSPSGEIYVNAEEVATSLLKYVKKTSESFQGKPLLKAVITVPAKFTENQKASTFNAAKLAGFEEVKLLPEPIAASFAYFINREMSNNSTVLLFDLGGGTLDVCIFKIINDHIQIICNGGDSKLGGRDFDTVLINYFKNLLLTNHGISLMKNKKYKLMLECQKIKENLTTAEKSCLDIEEFDTNVEGLIHISREEFEKMTQALLNKIKNTINAALFKSNLKENQMDKILLVGGGSRMPMIKNLLKELFPKADHCCEEHPDEVVAIGAAYYAYSIFSAK